MTFRGRIGPALGLAIGLMMGAQATVAPAQIRPPGPESFAKPPTTPAELWDAADYLVRTGQAPLAVPYLRQFLKGNPDDQVFLDIHDNRGTASVLRLDDDPATRPYARPILDRLNAALRRVATSPDRLQKAISSLSRSKAEQDYGVDRLREAGAYAIPPLVRALADPGLDRESRALIVANMGRLDTSVVPALVAALGASDRTIGADAADVLGRLGDTRALPFLTYPAAWPEPSALQDAARRAIARITGRPYIAQPRTPARSLADEAWRYERHQVKFGSDPTIVWLWEDEDIVPRTVPVTTAESILGGRFAREALALDPADRSAQAALVSLALEKSVERDGVGVVVTRDPSGAFSAAMAGGPAVLTDVLKTAIHDGHGDLASAAAFALGRVAGRDADGTPDVVSPLVSALSAPDRGTQYAAASALVEMNPDRPFPGSSLVVPTLSRFVANRSPRALVVDGNLSRANSVASTLKRIGYEPTAVTAGGEAFRDASESADVEVILIEPTMLQGAWSANDLMANLRADGRTAGTPIFLYGPLDLRDRLGGRLTNYPRVGFLVTPTSSASSASAMSAQLATMGVRAFSAADREGFARGSASLLAAIASRPNSPMAADLPRVAPALIRALRVPASAGYAATILGDVPGGDAQRSLADLALDSGPPPALRLDAARNLARSLQKFGPLLSPEQESRLVAALDAEPDPTLKGAFATVYGALRPRSADTGRRLQAFRPTQAAAPPPTPAPAAAPGPASPPAEPGDGAAEKPEGTP